MIFSSKEKTLYHPKMGRIGGWIFG